MILNVDFELKLRNYTSLNVFYVSDKSYWKFWQFPICMFSEAEIYQELLIRQYLYVGTSLCQASFSSEINWTLYSELKFKLLDLSLIWTRQSKSSNSIMSNFQNHMLLQPDLKTFDILNNEVQWIKYALLYVKDLHQNARIKGLENSNMRRVILKTTILFKRRVRKQFWEDYIF